MEQAETKILTTTLPLVKKKEKILVEVKSLHIFKRTKESEKVYQQVKLLKVYRTHFLDSPQVHRT